jgi:hypothetical protein
VWLEHREEQEDGVEAGGQQGMAATTGGAVHSKDRGYWLKSKGIPLYKALLCLLRRTVKYRYLHLVDEKTVIQRGKITFQGHTARS